MASHLSRAAALMAVQDWLAPDNGAGFPITLLHVTSPLEVWKRVENKKRALMAWSRVSKSTELGGLCYVHWHDLCIWTSSLRWWSKSTAREVGWGIQNKNRGPMDMRNDGGHVSPLHFLNDCGRMELESACLLLFAGVKTCAPQNMRALSAFTARVSLSNQ